MPIGKRWTGAASAASSLLVAAALLVPLAGVASADPTSETSATMPPRPTTETGDPQAPAAPTSTMPARPTTDVAPGTSDRFSRLAVTPFGCSSYWNPGFNRSFTVCGRILDKYNEFGGPGGKLGLPTSDELVNPDNVGRRTSFQNDASIYWSPTTDAHQLGGEIGKKWCELGCESVLGYPTSDELVNPDNVGRRNSFQNDVSIYWSPATGAHSIGGAIGAEWAARGYEGGPHGYPATDELRNGDGVGRRNIFQGGSIYYHPATGAHTIWGAIRDNWASRNYENGRFGYPTSNEFAFEGGWAQNFQHGTIDWKSGDPANPADIVEPTGSKFGDYGWIDPTVVRAGTGAPTSSESEPTPDSDVPVTTEGTNPDTESSSPAVAPSTSSGSEESPAADNFLSIRPARTQDEPDDPDLGACGTQINLTHPANTRPDQIHTRVVSKCPAPGMTGHEIEAKTGRYRWFGLAQPLPEADGIPAKQGPAAKTYLRVTTAVWCTRGTTFDYRVKADGKFYIGSKKFTTSHSYIEREVTCEHPGYWPN